MARTEFSDFASTFDTPISRSAPLMEASAAERTMPAARAMPGAGIAPDTSYPTTANTPAAFRETSTPGNPKLDENSIGNNTPILDTAYAEGMFGSDTNFPTTVYDTPRSDFAPLSISPSSGRDLDHSDAAMNANAQENSYPPGPPTADAVIASGREAIGIWKQCIETIRPQLSAQTMRTWFEPLQATAFDGAELTLQAPSNFFREWIAEHYQEVLEKALAAVMGTTLGFRIESASEVPSVNTTLTASPAVSPSHPGEPSRPTTSPSSQTGQSGYSTPGGYIPQNRYTPQGGYMPQGGYTPQGGYAPQGGYVPQSGYSAPGPQGTSSRIPYSSPRPPYPPAQAPRTSPYFSPSSRDQQQSMEQQAPLPTAQQLKRPPIEGNLNLRYTFDTFIRGESNKLAYAASMAVANNPGGTRYNPLVIYGNVGLGKTHLIQAIGNAVLTKFSGARVLYTSSDKFTVEFVDSIQNDRINEFQALYRSIDVLIIDDVQFFAGKEKTQDIFFHTFNALRELGKQIILTCDRAPKELKDIDDRLLNRLQWGLTADISTPDLETRIAILRHKAIADGIDLSNEVIEFIATNVTTNIRELEGCLISLLATASLEGREPTIEIAKDVLRKVAKRSAPVLTIETIQRSVSKKFGIEEELMRAKTRKQEIVEARQVAMFLAKELTNNSLKTIGLHFGGRDHSTVIHAVQTVLDDIKHNPALHAKIEELRRQFEMMQ